MLCIDHPKVQALIGQIEDRRIITYGLSPQADVRAEEPAGPGRSGTTFDVIRSPTASSGDRTARIESA